MIVLASASPRRQELLRNAGIPFTVQSADIHEMPLAGEAPRVCAERLAREKALSVFRRQSGNYVLGADTVVVVDDTILAIAVRSYAFGDHGCVRRRASSQPPVASSR